LKLIQSRRSCSPHFFATGAAFNCAMRYACAEMCFTSGAPG
jgi:hypothetical protein